MGEEKGMGGEGEKGILAFPLGSKLGLVDDELVEFALFGFGEFGEFELGLGGGDEIFHCCFFEGGRGLEVRFGRLRDWRGRWSREVDVFVGFGGSV